MNLWLVNKGNIVSFVCAFLGVLAVIPATFAQLGVNETTLARKTKAKVFVNKKNEVITRNITQRRKLSDYDDGGSFDCTRLDLSRVFKLKPGTKGVCDETKIRNFIRQHWLSKRRGYIRASYAGIDTSNTEHIFIEPDKSGNWTIRWRSVNASAFSRDGELIDIAKIVSVERAENKPSAGEWALVFKNAEGTIVWMLPYFPL